AVPLGAARRAAVGRAEVDQQPRLSARPGAEWRGLAELLSPARRVGRDDYPEEVLVDGESESRRGQAPPLRTWLRVTPSGRGQWGFHDHVDQRGAGGHGFAEDRRELIGLLDT